MQHFWASGKTYLDRFFSIVANISWRDSIPLKQQWQGFMCWTSQCSIQSLWQIIVHICSPFLDTMLANIMFENTWYARKIFIICSESSQWRVEHSPNPSLSCYLNNLLIFFRGNAQSFSKTGGSNDGFWPCLSALCQFLSGLTIQLQDYHYP